MSNGRPVHFEAHYAAPKNTWIECHAYPSSDGLSVYFRDISERKHAEATIARSQAEALSIHRTLEGVLAGMTDGLNIVDLDWRYTYFNEQAALLLGVRAEDMLGKRMWDMFPAAEDASFGLKMREAVASGETTHTLDFYPEPSISGWIVTSIPPARGSLSTSTMSPPSCKRMRPCRGPRSWPLPASSLRALPPRSRPRWSRPAISSSCPCK
jgi:PAS domain-containing protein